MFWPGHINDAGGIRRQFHHIIDIAPKRLVDPKEAKALLDEVRTGLSAGGNRIRTCMGLFLSSSHFWFVGGSLFGAGKPFFVPSPAIRFAERAEGVKGPKR